MDLKFIILAIIFISIGIIVVSYRTYNINCQIRENLEVSEECEKNCSLAPVNTKLSLIDTRLDNLEKQNKDLQEIVNKNKTNVDNLQKRLKEEEEEFKKATQVPPS